MDVISEREDNQNPLSMSLSFGKMIDKIYFLFDCIFNWALIEQQVQFSFKKHPDFPKNFVPGLRQKEV